MRRTDKIFKTM